MRQTTQADIDALRAAIIKDLPPSQKPAVQAALNIAIDALFDLSSIAHSFERIAAALEPQIEVREMPANSHGA